MENKKDYIIVKLPSNGKCYPINSALRSGNVKVSYLTAKDENIFYSHKLRLENKICITLLEKKVLGDFDVSQFCSGDKEAIILNILKENYGNIYNFSNTDKVFDLNGIKYKDLNLECDDNGYFTYSDKDKIIYKLLPFQEEEEIIKIGTNAMFNYEKTSAEELYIRFVKSVLPKMVISINDETNKDIIQNWFDNADYEKLNKFQNYVTENSPVLDLKTTSGIVFDDTIFYNIR